MTKPRFILDSTFYKTSAEKNWPNSSFKSCLNFNFKILTKLFAQSLNKHLDFWPNLGFQICNKLLPTRSSSATVTTSTSFELASSHARVTSIKFTKQEWVSQWVSQSVSDKGKQWSDSGPIKIYTVFAPGKIINFRINRVHCTILHFWTTTSRREGEI